MKNEKCLVVCIVLLIIINIQDGCFGADDTDIRILVLLPSTDNSYKLPFGYEVGGGAGRFLCNNNKIKKLSCHSFEEKRVPWENIYVC